MRNEEKATLNKYRYRLYREHKYIFYIFSELLQLVSTMDFSDKNSLTKLQDELKNLSLLLQSHAQHEEERIHRMLKNKNSPLFQEAEEHHQNQQIKLDKLREEIKLIMSVTEQEEINFLGCEMYLDLRKFFSENLDHFDYEERVIMPELQRLFSDEEIREIDRISYQEMSPEQMVDMMEVLFPHMNCDDRFVFLKDIKDCQPQKFDVAWIDISSHIEVIERNNLIKILDVQNA